MSLSKAVEIGRRSASPRRTIMLTIRLEETMLRGSASPRRTIIPISCRSTSRRDVATRETLFCTMAHRWLIDGLEPISRRTQKLAQSILGPYETSARDRTARFQTAKNCYRRGPASRRYAATWVRISEADVPTGQQKVLSISQCRV